MFLDTLIFCKGCRSLARSALCWIRLPFQGRDVFYPFLTHHPSPYTHHLNYYAQVSDLLQQRGKYRKLFGVKSELFEVATLHVIRKM